MTSLSLHSDRRLTYFQKRLLQLYGNNLSSAILLGVRARGKSSPRSPYDIVLFLRANEPVGCSYDKAELLQLEMLETFDAQFNLYPFSSDAIDNSDGIMRAIRMVGIPFVVSPAAEAAGKPKVSDRAERVLNHNDILCIDMQTHAVDAYLTAHEIRAASVRNGTVREWTIILPTPEATSIYPSDNSELGFEVEEQGNDKLDDPAIIKAVTSLLEATGDNKLLSVDADLVSGLFNQIFRICRGRIQSLRVRSAYFDKVGDYTAAVQRIAEQINPSEPELALCRAEFNARKAGSDMDAAHKGVRHQAEVIRHLLNID